MVAVSRFGGTTDLAARVALQANGLDPQKDVVLIMIGLGNTRNAALIAGSVDANIANPPDNSMLKQKGFRELLFLGDAMEFPSNGFTTTERRLAENRDQVKRLLRAFYRGLLFSRDNPEESIKIVEREWKLDAATARDSYQSIMKAASRDGASSDAGLKVHIKLIQNSDKTHRRYRVEQDRRLPHPRRGPARKSRAEGNYHETTVVFAFGAISVTA